MNKSHKTIILSALLISGFAGAVYAGFGIGFGVGGDGPRVGIGFSAGDRRYADDYYYDDGYYDDDGYWVDRPYRERRVVIPRERRVQVDERPLEAEKNIRTQPSTVKSGGEEGTKK